MAGHEDVLYLVERRNIYTGSPSKAWLFRTRAKAQKFKNKKNEANKSHRVVYAMLRVEWGPDSVS